VVVAGLNLTHQLPITLDFNQRLRGVNAVGKFCSDVVSHYINVMQKLGSSPYLHDSCAVMYCIKPDLFTFDLATVDVETKGLLCYGATVADYKGYWASKGRSLTHKVLQKVVDVNLFYQLQLDSIKNIQFTLQN